MNYRIYRAADFQVQPWKNGQGITTELFRLPEGGADYLLRISIAQVNSSGPFSVFSGYERTIIQLSGRPMTLTHEDGKPRELRLLEPHHFSGDDRTDCVLPEPAEDYNVIFRRGALAVRTEVATLKPGLCWPLTEEKRNAVVYCLAGGVGLDGRDHEMLVSAGELLQVTSEKKLPGLRAGRAESKVIVTCW